MTDTTHEGNDPMGALTTHRGRLADCPAPDCQDRIIKQQEEDAVSSPPDQTLRDRIAEALAPYFANFSDWETAKINAGEAADAVLAVLHSLTLRELEQLARPNTPPSRPEPRIPDHTVNEEEAPAPVKQRADCTELEWAEQERARFERLYTRESVRVDQAEKRAETAKRDADIYRQRLERLGEGYTEQCKRAEQAEAEAERLRAGQAAVCICGHAEQQHFEDACLVCGCGDYLVPEAAREVIDRWQAAAGKAERIRENADFHLGQEMARRQLAEKEADRLREERRRLAAEAPQPDIEAHPPQHAWRVETRDPLADQWAPGSHFAHRPNAVERLDTANRTAPLWNDGTPVERRIVRETTTYTVEAEGTRP